MIAMIASTTSPAAVRARRAPFAVAVAALAAQSCAVSGPAEPPGADDLAAQTGVIYGGPASQFAGGFAPTNAPYGGFGGGTCVATRTPIVFVHGNTVNASFIARPTTTGAPTVYAALRAAGYNDCELFGITWLAPSEQGDANQQYNFHTATKAARIRDFVNAVKAYTGKAKVTILAHSMGVTVAMHGLTYGNLWGSVDAFVNVAGGLRGLSACLQVGYANPLVPTCGSQNVLDANAFGFWPDGAGGAANPRTGTTSTVGFRAEPARRPGVRFYTLSGGAADDIVGGSQCLFASASAVKAQLEVGIDHLSTFTDTGAIVTTMLGTACTGAACCAGYAGTCVAR